jgi:hypothetical protein
VWIWFSYCTWRLFTSSLINESIESINSLRTFAPSLEDGCKGPVLPVVRYIRKDRLLRREENTLNSVLSEGGCRIEVPSEVRFPIPAWWLGSKCRKWPTEVSNYMDLG